MKKLNVGCGKFYIEGWVNHEIGKKDIHGEEIKSDVQFNLDDFPYPFKDNCFDEILVKYVFQHVSNPIKVVEELIRISKDGAKIEIIVPHFSTSGAYTCPEHKHYYNSYSMMRMNHGQKYTTELIFSYNRFLNWLTKVLSFNSQFFYETIGFKYLLARDIKWEIIVRK